MKQIIFLLFFMALNGFSQSNYEIYAVKFASRTTKIPNSARAVGDKSNDSTGVDYMVWVIKNKEKVILVDAGFTRQSMQEDMIFTSPDTTLQKLSIKPEDITDIIITHPHWDHIGGIELFPNAMIWMQKEDYNYFVGEAWQKEGNNLGFYAYDVQKLVKKNTDKKLTLVKGDNLEILPGIKVFTGSKHTFESQFVAVGNDNDRVIIASDNCWFYYNVEKMFSIPFTFDQSAYIASLKRMKEMVKDPKYIIPGHDPLIFSKFPKVSETVVKIK